MKPIYVVEDDTNIREIELFALKNCGYDTKGFERASDFWQGLKSQQPALVLLDLMLPDEDGLAVLRKLRESRETRDLPII
ncbi:MAG: response regulator, partial [Lachnospiraceae bacterium]|nr:response regulator [Lachnospiraceae bacterium]